MLGLNCARKLFVQALAGVYFLALSSSFSQWPALHSSTHGLIPIAEDAMWFSVHLAGIVVAFAITVDLFTSNLFCILPLCYWSIVTCSRRSGAPFFAYQWDSLLIESGVVGAMWGIQSVDASRSVLWALRFLAFKVMFMSGVVKILSNDAVWLDMTALKYHFASQPLPTPLAWYVVRYAPDWLLKLGTAGTFWIEIPVSLFLIFPPIASWPRQVAAGLTCLLMLMIALTGNYNFFNLLTVVLMIPCIASEDVSSLSTRQCLVVSSVCALALAYYTCFVMFDLQTLTLRITPMELTNQIQLVLPLATVSVLTCAVVGLALDLKQAWYEHIAGFHVTLGLGVLAVAFILMSLTPMIFSLHAQAVMDILPDRVLEHYQRYGKEFAFSYGLFRSMTGVGAAKQVSVPTLRIVETFGTQHDEEQVSFRYYGNDLQFVAPHQPRLDWQMWFAALAPEYAVRQPWFRALIERLFERDALLMEQHYVQTAKRYPVESIRVELVHLDFSPNEPWWRPALPPHNADRTIMEINRPVAKKRVKKSPLLTLWTTHSTELALSIVLGIGTFKFTMW